MTLLHKVSVLILSISSCAALQAAPYAPADSLDSYLFVFFTDPTHSLFMATSDDGYNFFPVNNGDPVISGDSIAEQRGIRDPHVSRDPHGNFYLAMTDLHIFAKDRGFRDSEWERPGEDFGWGNNRSLVLMKSPDLINWSHSIVHVDSLFPDKFGDIGCAWAPETTYDPSADRMMIYFTMRHKNEKTKLYYAYTDPDFTTIVSEPKILFEYPDEAVPVLDADIVPMPDGRWCMTYAMQGPKWGIKMAVSDSISGPWTYRDEYVDFEPGACEAPNVWKRLNEDKWVVMYDVFSLNPHNFGFAETSDFIHFSNLGHFNEPGSPMKLYGVKSPKHGSVIPISASERKRLHDYWDNRHFKLPPFPEIPEPLPLNSVEPASSDSFDEVILDIPVTDGPFAPSWESIEQNYPGTPQWLRDAKIGFWVHFGPQAAGESGDWYARNLYKEDHYAYKNHLKRYGHPSEVGYKEVLRDWNPSALNPDSLTRLYHRAGARFLMIQGVHHDNFDLWNSRYQPWNSVNIGPHRDLLKEWADACRKYGMRYGVTFHHEYTWWWWQTAFGHDSTGPKKDVNYDGHLTLADGVGKWWEGLDPRFLYGIDLREYQSVDERAHSGWSPPVNGIFSRHLDFAKWYATQWALRMMDVTENYNPDFIYTDGTVQGPFTGYGTGTGYKCNAMPIVMADFYNRSIRQKGDVDVFSIVKFRNSAKGTVNTAEFDFPDSIVSKQDWIREAPVGDWFYAPGFIYDSGMMIRFIIESIARDGNAAINICLRPDGSIEQECVTMLEEVGDWMNINGDAVYGSKAWDVLGEGEIVNGKLRSLPGGALGRDHADFKFSSSDFRFTVGRDGAIYAFCMTVPGDGETLSIKSLASSKIGDIKNVSLLGCDQTIEFAQTPDALTITCPKMSNIKTSAVFRIQP